ncbi:MAG: molybdenum cofactor guanylyltransferase [Chloroflexi bacterium]|nr:molybdenum cofactor guanylyltransferase [Chloroflexota bacterium]
MSTADDPPGSAAASAVVLAGGASRRMGRDKRLLPWGTDADGRPRTLLQAVVDTLAAVTDDVIVVANDRPDVGRARVVPDAIPGSGSLGGILSGIEAALHKRVFVAAVDMPFLNVALVRDLLDRLGGHDAVVPVIGGRPEPLHAVYGPAVATAARRQIAQGQLKIALAYEGLEVVRVPEADLRRVDPELRSFRNVNTPEDYTGARTDAALPNTDMSFRAKRGI